MPAFKFKNIDKLKRNREVEGVTGTELGLSGGVTLHLYCASDANPRWQKFGEDFRAELRRLTRANASDDRVKQYLARELTRLFVFAWEGVVDEGDHTIPFTADACEAFLLEADDVIPAIQEIVYDNKNFRGQRINAVAAELKN